ncbi:MAG: hypothetical protein CMM56_10275 [Rhodospirillaceae bacterium]|nr:hypothetical protein [Rhodospirillaceae bacterium]
MIIKSASTNLFFLLCVFGVFSFQERVLSQEPFVPTENNTDSQTDQSIYQLPIIILQSVVIRDRDNLIPLLPDIKQLGDFKYELMPGSLSSFYLTQARSEEPTYKLVQELNSDAYKISDGSLLIEYVDGVSTAVIANDYTLKLILDFPSVRTASFQSENFSGLAELVLALMHDERINSVTLDLIDPSVGPR